MLKELATLKSDQDSYRITIFRAHIGPPGMHYLDFSKSLQDVRQPNMPGFPPSIGLIHFVGIGGIGQSAIALTLKGLGYTVQGSDAKESSNTERLRAAGITVFIGHDPEYVNSARLVVASASALTIKFRVRDNIEVESAREKGIPVIHRAMMLAALMRHKKAIAISGSHGKSTTTTMVAGLLEAGGLTPTVINGAVMNLYESNAQLGSGDWMVVEADESDGSFLWLPALVTVVTNIDSDHIIFWKSQDKTREAFTQFIRNVPFHGLGVLCIDDAGVRQILPSVQDRNIITYGTSEDADVRAVDIAYSSQSCTFLVSIQNQRDKSRHNVGPFTVNALGLGNVQNSLAAIAIALELGIEHNVIQKSLSTFPGLHQRFNRVGEANGITVIDDHAAHPAEIKNTLRMARQAGARRIIAVDQPSAISGIVRGWLDEYPAAFEEADHVIIGQTEGARPESAAETREVLVECLQANGVKNVISMADAAQLPELVSSIAQEGDFVVCTGFQTATDWARKLPEQLKALKSA